MGFLVRRPARPVVAGRSSAGREVRGVRAVEVTGESMLPTLRPGDYLLVRRRARIAPGDVVVARHPELDRMIVKRAAWRDGDGWWLESDNQGAAGRQDSWDFGAVPDGLIVGRVVARYWPRPALRLPRR